MAGRTVAASVSGAVVVAHGGRSVSTEPVTRAQPAVLRMVPFVRAIRHGLRGSGWRCTVRDSSSAAGTASWLPR